MIVTNAAAAGLTLRIHAARCKIASCFYTAIFDGR